MFAINNEMNMAHNQLRQTNIEALRIVSMLMIVAHHFSLHGSSWMVLSTCNSLSNAWLAFIGMGGMIGTNVFVLISGYFLILDDGPLFQVKRFLKLTGEMFFYAVTVYLMFVVLDKQAFTIASFSRTFLPFREWWFATTYLQLFIIHRLVNVLLKAISKKKYQQLILMLTFFFCVFPSITHRFFPDRLLWFVYLYSLTGYVRLHGFDVLSNNRLKPLFMLAFGVGLYVIAFLLEICGIRFLRRDLFIVDQYCNILNLIVSVTMFCAFVKMKMNNNRLINVIAASTFGIYLIHDHEAIRKLLWNEIFEVQQFMNLPLIVPYSIAVILFVFVVCSMIDVLRMYLFEKPFVAILNRNEDRMNRFLNRIVQKVVQFVFR